MTDKEKWIVIEAKARVLKAAAVQVIIVAHAVNKGNVAQEPLHADTLNKLKTVRGPAALVVAKLASTDLDAAITS